MDKNGLFLCISGKLKFLLDVKMTVLDVFMKAPFLGMFNKILVCHFIQQPT